MGKIKQKNPVKDYFEEREIFSKSKKLDKAVAANSIKMHELDRKLEFVNDKIDILDNKPKRRRLNFDESAKTLIAGAALPMGIALCSAIGASIAPEATQDIQAQLATYAIHSTVPLALATYLAREFRVAGRTFDALKKRALIKQVGKIQEDINSCKIYQIALTGQEYPIAESIAKQVKTRLSKKPTRTHDSSFRYLDQEITEENIEHYDDIMLNFD